MHVLVAGCGWLGCAVARLLLARGDRVTGLRSDPVQAQALAALGIEPLVLDLADPGAGAAIPGDVDAILALQAARGGDEAAYRRAYLQGNATLLLAARRLGVKGYVYTGSTGLFGQSDGSEVREDTPPQPATAPARVLAQAEALLQEAAGRGVPARILRLSGLYGPGRLWMIDRVRSGQLGLGPGDLAWLNSCHQDDAAATVLAVLDRGRDGAIYHGTDAVPMRRSEVIEHVAARLGLAAPRAPEGPGAVGLGRRISGAATRAELGLALRWPSLREGLEPFLSPRS